MHIPLVNKDRRENKTKHYQSSIGGFLIHLVLVGGSMSSISKSLTHSSEQKTKHQ